MMSLADMRFLRHLPLLWLLPLLVLCSATASGKAVERGTYFGERTPVCPPGCVHAIGGVPTIYAPGGAVRGASAIDNQFLYTGQRWFADLGLYYYRNRWYDPHLGRFLSRDPLGIWGDPMNLGNGTAYVGLNPWTFVDPLGLYSDEVVCRTIKDSEGKNPAYEFYGILPEPYDPSVGRVPKIPADADLSLKREYPGVGMLIEGGEFVARTVVEPLDWAMTADEMGTDFGEGKYVFGTAAALGFLPVLSGMAAKKIVGDPLQEATDKIADRVKRLRDKDLIAPPKKRGNAPIGKDGSPVELHHDQQLPNAPLEEMTRTNHRGGGNFTRNHENTGQCPTQIDREKWNKERRAYWNEEWDRGRFDDFEEK